MKVLLSKDKENIEMRVRVYLNKRLFFNLFSTEPEVNVFTAGRRSDISARRRHASHALSMHARSCTLYTHAPIQLYYVHNYAMYIMKISDSMASLLAAL